MRAELSIIYMYINKISKALTTKRVDGGAKNNNYKF